MANYTPRVLKSGHINMAIQIYVKDATGKSVCKCTTFTNPDNLTGKRLEKAAYAFGQDWERKMRNGNEKDLNEATFCEIADIWLKSKKAKMSTSYKVRAIEGVERLKKYFGNRKFVDIKEYIIKKEIFDCDDHHIKDEAILVWKWNPDLFDGSPSFVN